MNFIVCFAVTIFSTCAADVDISWPHIPSPVHYGSSLRPFPSYEAHRNHIKAKYYARKAHDLAKLRSSIYGIGHGLYGFRYGSHFPSHFSKPFPLLPFVNKYPIFDVGLYDYPSPHIPHHFFPGFVPSISGHLTGFGYPKSYHNSYGHSYSYGKGYSYGNKHSYGFHKPDYHYSSIKNPFPASLGYIKKQFPSETVVYESGNEPHSHGYQYSYVRETPDHSKFLPTHDIGGYDSIYGIRYNDFGHGSDYKKYPVQNVVYETHIPVQSNQHNLIPFSELELDDEGLDEDSYIPLHVSSHEKFSDITPDEDIHSLNIENSPPLHTFGSSDHIAYGSEKSETVKPRS